MGKDPLEVSLTETYSHPTAAVRISSRFHSTASNESIGEPTNNI
jgi:hypothetical protein